MSFRQHSLNSANLLVTFWGMGFTIDLVARADKVTSRQWQYLMSVPGQQWAWVSVFGTATALLIAGQLARAHRLCAAGCAIAGFGAGMIGVFYMAAPVIDPGLTTLGYWPWLLTMFVMLVAAVINWKPAKWFC